MHSRTCDSRRPQLRGLDHRGDGFGEAAARGRGPRPRPSRAAPARCPRAAAARARGRASARPRDCASAIDGAVCRSKPCRRASRSPAPAGYSTSSRVSSASDLARLAHRRASTCSAETMPSPVVCLSRQMRWPEFSPPQLPAALAQQLEHVAVADLGARERRCPSRASAFSKREIGHQRADDAARTFSFGRAMLHDRVEQLVAVVRACRRASTITRRSPSPSKRDAEIGLRARPPRAQVRRARWRRTPSLMLKPSGWLADRDRPRRRARGTRCGATW